MAITTKNLAEQVEALKAYRAAQLKTYYGNDQQVDKVDECVSIGRLKDIGEAVGVKPEIGLRTNDGAPATKELTWNGCRFWAPVG